MPSSADLGPADTVLVVGGATGYSAPVLARLAASVVLLELDAGLTARAGEALAALGIANVSVATGPLAAGHPAGAPHDVIFLEGAVPARPDALVAQLKPAGRLVGIVTVLLGWKGPHIPEGVGWHVQPDCLRRFGGALAGFAAAPSFVF